MCEGRTHHFWKLFVELTHFTKMTSTYAPLTNCGPPLSISKGRHISSAQKCSIANAIANKCHNIDEFTCAVRTAESLTATAKENKNKKNASSSSLPCPCAYFTSCPPSSPFCFLPCPLTPDLLLTPFSSLSHSPHGTSSPRSASR